MTRLILMLTLVALVLASTPRLRVAAARHRSRSIARRRGVGRLAILTRDAPTIDLTLDLTTATADQLEAQRNALLHVIDNGTATGEHVERASAVVAAIGTHENAVRAAAAARAALLGSTVTRTANVAGSQSAANDNTPPGGGDEQPVSLARAFTSSPEFRAYNGHGQTQVTVPGEVRALFGTTGYPSTPTRIPGVLVPNRDTPLTILDMIDRQNIDTNSVEWVQETGYPANAGTVAEGGVKPESTFGYELKQDSARVIAHWVKFTRQVLADESQVRGYIEGRLTYGLLRKVNEQVINGNGTSPNLRGILNTSGIGSYTAVAAEAALISIRRARTVAELSEYSPDAVAINPVDWERVELSSDTTGAFRVVANNVAQGATPRVWGLNVVITTNMTGTVGGGTPVGGTFLLGAFREGATLWERTGVELYMTDSHADDFTSNLITLLAELRAVLSVWRPKAFVKGTFSTGTA